MAQSDEATTPSTSSGFLERWVAKLREVSPAVSGYKEEQRRGWESPALDAFYHQRTASSQTQGSVSGTSTAATSFDKNVVDIEQLCERYCAHASIILSRCAFFSPAPPQKRFVDFGAAPGGVSSHLLSNLRWCGVAVTLPEKDGGIAMAPRVKQFEKSHATSFSVVEKSILDDDLVSVIRSKFHGEAIDFVNCGAVQDHCQRSNASGSSGNDADNTSKSNSAAYALPWFTFLVPQLMSALSLVRSDGAGSIMFVYGMSQCGSLFLLLHLLVDELKIVSSYDNVYFFETMHLMKPPVYVLLTNVTSTEERVSAVKSYFVYGAAAAACEANSFENGAAKSFWTLEDARDETRALEAFQKCGRGLEKIWEKATSFLQARREKAERYFAKQASRSSYGSEKRLRDN